MSKPCSQRSPPSVDFLAEPTQETLPGAWRLEGRAVRAFLLFLPWTWLCLCQDSSSCWKCSAWLQGPGLGEPLLPVPFELPVTLCKQSHLLSPECPDPSPVACTPIPAPLSLAMAAPHLAWVPQSLTKHLCTSGPFHTLVPKSRALILKPCAWLVHPSLSAQHPLKEAPLHLPIFIYLATPMACRNSRARDGAWPQSDNARCLTTVPPGNAIPLPVLIQLASKSLPRLYFSLKALGTARPRLHTAG